MPEFVPILFIGIAIIVAGGIIYSGLAAIAKAIKEKS